MNVKQTLNDTQKFFVEQNWAKNVKDRSQNASEFRINCIRDVVVVYQQQTTKKKTKKREKASKRVRYSYILMKIIKIVIWARTNIFFLYISLIVQTHYV